MSGSSRSRGFTLVELLVSVAIVALLVGLTLPAVQKVRESARRTDCADRLRNQGLAVLHFESARGALPPGALHGPNADFGVPDGAGHGMWPLLLAYLDHGPAAARYRLDKAYDAAENQPAATAAVKVLVCPGATPQRTDPFDPPPAFGAVADYAPLEVNPFLADTGLIDPVACFESALPANKMVKMTEIVDGASNTLLLAEAAGRPGVAWCSPILPVSLRQVFGGSGGLHRNGTHACLADGSVRFLRDTLDVRTLGRLATRAGGEPTPVGF